MIVVHLPDQKKQMELSSYSRRVLWFAAVFLVLAALLYPIQSTVSPEWKVRVIDSKGSACEGMEVQQHWGHYSYYLDGYTQSARVVTDSDGIANLPPRKIRASLLRRILVPPVAFMLQFAHGSFGPSSAVWASGIKKVAWLSYRPGEPLPDTMTVERCFQSKIEADDEN